MKMGQAATPVVEPGEGRRAREEEVEQGARRETHLDHLPSSNGGSGHADGEKGDVGTCKESVFC